MTINVAGTRFSSNTVDLKTSLRKLRIQMEDLTLGERALGVGARHASPATLS